MKGPTADDSAKMMSRPSSKRMRMGGPSHHFLRTFRNSQSSAMIEALCLVDSIAFFIGINKY